LIARSFLASISKDAKGMQTKVEVQIASEMFECNGQTIQEKNYLEVYTFDTWNDSIIPNFT
jgi:DNA topoisomerase-3